ncbi:MAG: hypothetical protein HYY02_08045, partial [Chloroflexi bacterium]|nr:hypothetical protein [Chloroflexota bacterium]
MRRRGLLIFAVMIPLSVTLGTGAASALDSSVSVPTHLEPAVAPASLDLAPLFTFAEQMLSQILRANTAGLNDLRRTILSANLPALLRPLMQKLVTVSLEFRAVIAQLDVVLPAAEESIRRRHIPVARARLAEARILVRQGQGLLDELEAGIDRMIEQVATYRRFRPRTPGLLPDLREQLQGYWHNYLKWLERLEAELQDAIGQRAVETETSLEPDSDRVPVGGELAVSGRLTAEGQGLTDRVIDIHLGQATEVIAVTDGDGWFQGRLAVPYVYNPSIRLEAWFTPDDVDRQVYLGSSAALELALVYVPTDFTVEALPVARPGRPLPITVAMAADATPADGRTLLVTLLGRTMVETRCPGRCTVEAQVPADAPLGHQTITVSVPASGLYAGASKNVDVTVALIPTSLSLTLPGLALAPGVLEVSGAIAVAEGAPGPGAIHIRLGDTLQRVEPLGSTFKGRLDLPLWPPVSGLRGLEVSYH